MVYICNWRIFIRSNARYCPISFRRTVPVLLARFVPGGNGNNSLLLSTSLHLTAFITFVLNSMVILVVESLVKSLGAMCCHFCISRLFTDVSKGFSKSISHKCCCGNIFSRRGGLALESGINVNSLEGFATEYVSKL